MKRENQDSWLAFPLADGALAVAVADGIGGAPGGRQASQTAIEMVRQHVAQANPGDDWPDLVAQINHTIHQQGQTSSSLAGMGTTLTIAVLDCFRLGLAHVGDSRAYRLASDRIIQCTADHSIAAEMERVGTLSAEEAAVHPQRHVLTRAVGPFIQVNVDTQWLDWSASDRLLLCTDGLYNAVAPGRILELCQRWNGQAAVDALLAEALAAGGPDNVTVVLVESSIGQG